MDFLLLACSSAITILLSIWLCVIPRPRTQSAKQHGNGPTLYPIIGCTLELLRNRDRFLEWSTAYLIKAPGNVITLKRLGDRNTYMSTSNPRIVEHILKTNFENYPKGDHIRNVLGDLLGDGIFNSDDELWRMQRKLASYEFTTRSLREYLMESLADEIVNRLVPTLDEVCKQGAKLDLQDLFQRFAFDSICKLAFGVDPACVHSSFPRVRFAEAFDTATGLITSRYFVLHSGIWRTMRALRIGSEKKLEESLRIIDEFAYSLISKRREALNLASGGDSKQNQDLLSRFIGADLSFSDKFLRDMIISFVLAGRDTTSVTLSWFFWLLSKHPRVEEKLVNEILSKTGGELKHSPSYDELRSMDYLQASLYESLRLYPAVPVDTKVARNSDVLPDGSFVKSGTRVTYNVYAMGRMEDLWGEDCLEFKPERWINQDGDVVAESPFKFTAFQAGPRVCLGKEMAILQMRAVVAAILPRFKFLVDDGFEPGYKMNMTLIMKELPVKPSVRDLKCV